MTDFSLRCATPTDHVSLAALFVKSYGSLLCNHYRPAVLASALPLMVKPQANLLASTTFYVAEVNSAIAACGGWTATVPGSKHMISGIGHVRHFATDPDMLRRGLASAILKHCKQAAGERQFKQLECWSTFQAAPFYEQHGFQRVREFEVVFPDGARFPSVQMMCAL
jgi:N-acetylglutamate synthase-like GNAT family acetyltransferase